MRIEDRKFLLFLDNCTSHVKINLSNISLCFLPPNTTSDLQPLDQGIIQATKLLYRKFLLQNCITKIEDYDSISEFSQSLNVLDAVVYLNLAWNNIKPSTVIKCFHKTGFNLLKQTQIEESKQVEEIEFEISTMLNDSLFVSKNIAAKEFADFDKKIISDEIIIGETYDDILQSQ